VTLYALYDSREIPRSCLQRCSLYLLAQLHYFIMFPTHLHWKPFQNSDQLHSAEDSWRSKLLKLCHFWIVLSFSDKVTIFSEFIELKGVLNDIKMIMLSNVLYWKSSWNTIRIIVTFLTWIKFKFQDTVDGTSTGKHHDFLVSHAASFHQPNYVHQGNFMRPVVPRGSHSSDTSSAYSGSDTMQASPN